MDMLMKCQLCHKSFKIMSGRNEVTSFPSLLPVTLTGCGHVFCSSCIVNKLLQPFSKQPIQLDKNVESIKTQQKYLITCPDCRATTTCDDINNLAINQPIVELLKTQQCAGNMNNASSKLRKKINNENAKTNHEARTLTDNTHSKQMDCSKKHFNGVECEKLQVLIKSQTNNHNLSENVHLSGTEKFGHNANNSIDNIKYGHENKRRSQSFSGAQYEEHQKLSHQNVHFNCAVKKLYPDISSEKNAIRLSAHRSNSTSDLFDDVLTRPPPFNPHYFSCKPLENNVVNISNLPNTRSPSQARQPKHSDALITKLPSLPPLASSLLQANLGNLGIHNNAQFDQRHKLRANKLFNDVPNENSMQINPFMIVETFYNSKSNNDVFNNLINQHSSTLYSASLSQIIESESVMMPPTRIALSSAANVVALIDPPANAVHIVALKLNQQRNIKVLGVTGCCFVSDDVMIVTTDRSMQIYSTRGDFKKEINLTTSSCIIGCVAMNNHQFAVICTKGLEIYKENNFSCYFIKSIKCKMLFEKGLAKKIKMDDSKKKNKLLSKCLRVEFVKIFDASWNNGMFAICEIPQKIENVTSKKKISTNHVENSNHSQMLRTITLVDDECGIIFGKLDLINQQQNIFNEPCEPQSVALGRDATLYVPDQFNGQIVKYVNIQGGYSSAKDDKKLILENDRSLVHKVEIFGIALNDQSKRENNGNNVNKGRGE
ncbi:hypothetical protein HELRODRAFT_189185 [Helobdella robusta]|uniref:RING-type domain-containing protein n=1 Tax=Helobdella robusta TaxID=6412 RepID=T1FQR5_HELRO|nr:hypothetical protein HELRODRAFT_189185 [Helobdella robusta]ESN96297.1 hypothetical protein HELRODRAFT_189185 [Helobdella robusta]